MTEEQKKIYNKYLEILREMFVESYNRSGLRASGKFERELEPRLTKSSFIMYGVKHSTYMQNGRGIGPADYKKLAPFMLDWIENKKGLPAIFYEKKKSMAFAVAHKVATKGIKVPNQFNEGNVISNVVEEFTRVQIPKLLNELGSVFLTRIRADVVNVLKEELTAA